MCFLFRESCSARLNHLSRIQNGVTPAHPVTNRSPHYYTKHKKTPCPVKFTRREFLRFCSDREALLCPHPGHHRRKHGPWKFRHGTNDKISDSQVTADIFDNNGEPISFTGMNNCPISAIGRLGSDNGCNLRSPAIRSGSCSGK